MKQKQKVYTTRLRKNKKNIINKGRKSKQKIIKYNADLLVFVVAIYYVVGLK